MFVAVFIIALIAFLIIGAFMRAAGAAGAAGSAMIQSARSTDSDAWFTEAMERGKAMRAQAEALQQPWKGR